MGNARARVLLAGLCGLLAALAVPAVAHAAATQVVRYDGWHARVPASWPVFHLGDGSRICVRFDRHAVYLGRPGSRQRCPAHAVGRTEALLVTPRTGAGALTADATEPGGPAAAVPSARRRRPGRPARVRRHRGGPRHRDLGP
jgi:hypothetical protein